MRSHPAYVGTSDYAIVSVIITDNESVWSEEAKDFRIMLESLGVSWADYRKDVVEDDPQLEGTSTAHIIPGKGVVWAPVRPGTGDLNPPTQSPRVVPQVIRGAPEEHATINARGEGSNKITEACIQSMQYERNLPPSWWERLSGDAQFLSNRYPIRNLDGNNPLDGDRASPIEILFKEWYSRHQVYRELDSYIGVGVPALCRCPKTKGSDLEPFARWGINLKITGRVNTWLCPYSGARFKSRTFSAYKLREGLNAWQFLGLPNPAPQGQSKALKGDTLELLGREHWILELREPQMKMYLPPPPVSEIVSVLDAESNLDSIRARADKEGKDICSFFPALKRVKNDEGMDVYAPLGELAPIQKPRTEDTELQPKVDVKGVDGSRLPIMSPADCLREPVDRDLQTDQGFPLIGDTDPISKAKPKGPLSGPRGKAIAKRQRAEQKAPKKGKKLESQKGPEPSTNATRLTSNKESSRSPGKGKTRQGRRKRTRNPSENANPTNLPKKGKPQSTTANHPLDDDFRVEINEDPELAQQFRDLDSKDAMLEDEEAERFLDKGVTTDGFYGWNRVCRMINNRFGMLAPGKHAIYRLWLLTKPDRVGESPIYVEDLPAKVCKSNAHLKEGLFLPYPSGPHWRRLLEHAQYRNHHDNVIQAEELEEEVAYLARSTYERVIHRERPNIKTACLAMLCNEISEDTLDAIIETEALRCRDELASDCKIAWRAAVQEAGKGSKPNPATVIRALLQDDAQEWAEALRREFQGLTDQGVFSCGHTLEDIRAR